MRRAVSMLAVSFIVAAGAAVPSAALVQNEIDYTVEPLTPTAVDALLEEARQSETPPARVSLVDAADAVFQGVAGQVPNVLRAMARMPRSVQPFWALSQAVIYEGTIAPEIKLAVGLRIAQLHGNVYLAAHTHRMLDATPAGRALAHVLASDALDQLGGQARYAMAYAASLTQDVHGVLDEEFAIHRSAFNDGEIVELTLTVSYFNYLSRMSHATGVPVEEWAFNDPFRAPARPEASGLEGARVNLLADDTILWAHGVVDRTRRRNPGATVFSMVNSQRAMMLSPGVGSAASAFYGAMSNGGSIGRELQLQVSFAVSTANGCRYCTLHQVDFLRRQGVSMDKLMAMQKDDSALTPDERTAVVFARKLTRTPWAITDEDVDTLKATFGEDGAVEVIHQTSMFAFMNRFTDGLRLPSEDAAVEAYREVYGRDFGE